MIGACSMLELLYPSATEEQLLGEIAYYKARLADIRKAPATSRHRDRLGHVADNLAQRERMLAQMRRYPKGLRY